ncbi:glycosyltransferase [Methyloradius palustris]|uniref:Rhamnosyltransferase WbbL n=1 Tax=Methyloradius palustris TaxID=2778876 RepID=A0A8D5FZY3_9PROT|nr:glycosyltransferase [Methyloradius palustris]BCM25277.1 rhamnosyltransferase WbbL [Methyloradius palustris]
MKDPLFSKANTISISIVSHLQGHLVKLLLQDIKENCKENSIEILLTINLPENLELDLIEYSFPIVITNNSKPKGFAENHNQAFTRAKGEYFCVLNPDIRINENPFEHLLHLLEDKSIGLAAPTVIGESGRLEDSMRKFPTPLKILGKVIGMSQVNDYEVGIEAIFPDWVAGMFMMFRYDMFKKLNGFDQKYFLYYEDVDLCARLRLGGHKVVVSPQSQIIHYARRSSHHKLKYLIWHLSSMLQFFSSAVYWQLKLR